MTKQEKAKELIEKYVNLLPLGNNIYKIAKQCAIIDVNDMIEQNGEMYLSLNGKKVKEYYEKKKSYLFELKQEIENL